MGTYMLSEAQRGTPLEADGPGGGAGVGDHTRGEPEGFHHDLDFDLATRLLYC
jgi:hypothetical protein